MDCDGPFRPQRSLRSLVFRARGKFAETSIRARGGPIFDSRVAINISADRKKEKKKRYQARWNNAKRAFSPLRSGKDKASSSSFAARQVGGK